MGCSIVDLRSVREDSFRIGVFVFEGAEELDWAGPWEVLSAWANQWPEDGVEVLTIARMAGVVRCAKGLRVVPDRSWAEAGRLNLLVYPGGRGTREHLDDPAVLQWVRELADAGTTLASVCTGSLVLAKAGLLDGRPATTHWSTIERLGQLGRGIDVRPDARYVDDGEILTAAGVSAGIDLALHLVARLHSVERAREVRRYIQYDPAPPV